MKRYFISGCGNRIKEDLPWANSTESCWSATMTIPFAARRSRFGGKPRRHRALYRAGRDLFGGHRAGAHHLCPPACPGTPYPQAPAILSNGSAIYDFDADRMLRQTFLPRESAAHLAELAEAFPALGFEAYHGEDIYVHNPNRVTRAHWPGGGGACRVPQRRYAAALDQGDPAAGARTAFVGAGLSARTVGRPVRDHFLQPPASGAGRQGQHQGRRRAVGGRPSRVGASTFIAWGQSERSSHAGLSAVPFAPSNCAAEVRDWGAVVVGSCDEQCVAQIIDILDARYPG